jgi:dsRNA-specific ribonuclease
MSYENVNIEIMSNQKKSVVNQSVLEDAESISSQDSFQSTYSNESGNTIHSSSSEKTVDIKKEITKDDDIVKEDGELIFDPFNSLNKDVTLNQVQSILTKYGVPSTVHNLNLYKRAFVHKSYVKRPYLENVENGVNMAEKPSDCMPLRTKSNERLEFLGDGVLECITKYYLYRRFPKENEGFMTEKKIAIVKNEHIGKLAYEMGLHRWYIISKHAEEKNIRTNMKKLGCLFEAFLGALFLDFNKISIHDDDKWFDQVFVTGPGFQIAQIFVENIFEKHINWTKLIKEDDNFKNILQVKVQKEFKITPTYLVINQDDDGYYMGVYICVNIPVEDIKHENSEVLEGTISFSELQSKLEEEGKLFVMLSSCMNKIKKKAEQTACEIAIQRIVP